MWSVRGHYNKPAQFYSNLLYCGLCLMSKDDSVMVQYDCLTHFSGIFYCNCRSVQRTVQCFVNGAVLRFLFSSSSSNTICYYWLVQLHFCKRQLHFCERPVPHIARNIYIYIIQNKRGGFKYLLHFWPIHDTSFFEWETLILLLIFFEINKPPD